MSSSERCEEKPDKNYKKACRQGYCPSLEERESIRIKELANKLRVESAEKTLTNVQEWQNKNISYWFERNQLFLAIVATTVSLICVGVGYCEEILLSRMYPLATSLAQLLLWVVILLGPATLTLWIIAIVMVYSYRKLPLRQLWKIFPCNISIDWILENRLCVCRDYAKLTACFLFNMYPENEIYFFHAQGHVAPGMKVGSRTYVLDKWLPVATIERWHERWHKGIIGGRARFRTVQKVKAASMESVPLSHLLMTSSSLPDMDNSARAELENELKTRLGIRNSTVNSEAVSLKVWKYKNGVTLYEDDEIVNQSLAERLKMLISDLMLEVNDITNVRVDRKKDDLIFHVDLKTSAR